MTTRSVEIMLTAMGIQKQLSTSIQVSSQPRYLPEESNPAQSLFVFAYRIRIANLGQNSAQLISRHWIITDGLGRIEEVRGAGVVGMQPQVQPGEYFEYESFCPLATSSGTMRGYYEFATADGQSFIVEVPEFFLFDKALIH